MYKEDNVPNVGAPMEQFHVTHSHVNQHANFDFRCYDDTCIPAAKECDGTTDCLFDEDEINCVIPEPTPPPTTVPITTSTPPVTISRTCTYNGVQYTTGQKWSDGWKYLCTCMDGTSGQYTCAETCPRYPQIPANCVLVQDFTNPCCKVVSCSTVAPTLKPQFNVCIRNGKAYTQGQKWFEGCDIICVCEDDKTGHYSCTDRCPTYATISPNCIIVTDPSDPCCQIPQCTSPNKSTIPQGAFVQGTGLNLTPIPNLQQTPGGVNTAVPQPNRNPTPYPGGTYAPGMIPSLISTLVPDPIVTPNQPSPQPISTAPTPSPTHVPITTLKTQSTPPVTTNSHNTQQFDNIKSSSAITRTETSESMILDGRQEQNREDMNDVGTLCQFVNAVLKTTPPALVLTTTTEIPQRPTVNNKTCGQSEIDIVIMLDSSTSVGNDNYTKMTNFCKAFLKHADIDSGNIRVGVLSYSTFVHVEFHLNDCNATPDIMEAIGAIRYRSGATNTADGLKIMRTQMFTVPNGDRNGVTNKLLILTDGVSNINPLNTIPEAEQARADGIHIYTIGIGLKDNQELYAMASVPAAENSFSLQDFDELAGLSDSLFNDICLVPSDSTAATPATVLTTTLKLPQRPTRNKNIPLNSNLDDDNSSVLNDSFIEENEFPDLDQSESSIVVAPINDTVPTPGGEGET
ncbi:Hypothetical predicted protein [Mytilus galloprovincialis]|uniref:VWFA domain-containing protein n=1 Tax=Mytilus galloprovincialis TaxID=29158 RepID=A0A8B6D1S4_MYTGA|nr:Hypothetical predicted protein [Mytilus galloprovincialis]